jgi:hypothetical protein
MDRKSADYLQRYFPDCAVKAIGMAEPEKKKPGRPKTGEAMTGAERQRRRRARLKAEKQSNGQ